MFIQGEIVKTFDYCTKYSILDSKKFFTLYNLKPFWMKNGLSLLVFYPISVALTCSFDESKKHEVQIVGDEYHKYRANRQEDPSTAKTWESDKLFMRKYFALQRNGESSLAFGMSPFFKRSPAPAQPSLVLVIWKLSQLGHKGLVYWKVTGRINRLLFPQMIFNPTVSAHQYLLNCKKQCTSIVRWGSKAVGETRDR